MPVLLLTAVGLLGPTASESDMGPDVRVDGIDEASVGDPLPPGWEVRPVRGHEAPSTEVFADSELGKVLRFTSRGQAAFYGHELESSLDAAAGGKRRAPWHPLRQPRERPDAGHRP